MSADIFSMRQPDSNNSMVIVHTATIFHRRSLGPQLCPITAPCRSRSWKHLPDTTRRARGLRSQRWDRYSYRRVAYLDPGLLVDGRLQETIVTWELPSKTRDIWLWRVWAAMIRHLRLPAGTTAAWFCLDLIEAW